MKVKHSLKPVYSKNSKVLILGSMPSVESRKMGKYYGNKMNRFWSVMEILYSCQITDWQEFIISHDLALWDVIGECDIEASSDASIRNVIPNDIGELISKTKIEHIFLLGKSAFNLYNKYVRDKVGIEGVYLPSTSSANARMSIEELTREYMVIKDASKK